MIHNRKGDRPSRAVAAMGLIKPRRGARIADRHHFRAILQPLEPRRLLATFTVTNPSDTAPADSPAPNTLRWAVEQADQAATPSTIAFDLTASPTIALTQGTLVLNNTAQSTTIDGPGAGKLSINGDGDGSVFEVVKGVTASLSGLTITGGSTSVYGGGVYSHYGTVSLADCTITGNIAKEQGGGLTSYHGTMTLTDCTISRNTAEGGGGGGLTGYSITMTGCTISGNSARYDGGGLQVYGMKLTDCTISRNSAGQNGGGTYGVGTITGCTISGNTAGQYGGGVWAAYGGKPTVLTDSIVAGNKAHTDGNIAVDSFHPSGGQDLEGSYNLIGTGGSGGLTTADHNLLNVADAGLAPLGAYGGPTRTLALLPGSPALGMGTAVNGVTTDQRGFPVDNPVDIGAFQGEALVVASAAGGVNTGTNPMTLAGAVSSANSAQAGPHLFIVFNPTTFASKETITLTGTPLSLSNTSEPVTIIGPAAGVIVSGGGESAAFQVDKGVTASFLGLSITGASGAAMEVLGTAILSDCTLTGKTSAPAMTGIDDDGGTLTASGGTVTGYATGVSVEGGATATLDHDFLTGDTTGLLVGSGADDTCTVTARYDRLSGDTLGIKGVQSSHAVLATMDYWGSSTGPGSTGSSAADGLVTDSPWLGDVKSLTLATPNSLGFAAASGDSYVVTPDTAGPSLGVSLDGTALATVTAGGTILFVGSGGGVTVDGESGTGFNTDAFTITNAAVTFGAADAFKGTAVRFSGTIGRTIAAKGSANAFYVSGWTGAGTLTAPAGTGTVVASKSAGFTLSDTALTATDGMSLHLSGITKAILTATAIGGHPTLVIAAAAFTGRTELTAAGSGDAILYGGSGKGGSLTATGSGDDILIGGPGADTLTDRGTGHSILIGGGGADTITGNGNDILISGKTSYDGDTGADMAALDAILGEWDSSDSYATRIDKITSGIEEGQETYALYAKTVQSDGVANTVSDGSGSDPMNWFIDSSKDEVSKATGETETIINAT